MEKVKNVISKDHFVNCIKVLEAADAMARRINKAVREYNQGDFINGYAYMNLPCESALIETLEIALNDKEHWISWWIYEADFGHDNLFAEVTINGGEIFKINSPEALYDFLVMES